MSKTVPNWLLNFWLGDGRPAPYGLLPPEKPAQGDERASRQQRRQQARTAAKGLRRRTMPVTVTQDNSGALARAISALVKQQVLVGVPEGNDRTPSKDDPTPLNNAAIAYIQEYGAPEANIPPRPFLMPGVDSVRDRVAETYKRAGTTALSGDLSAVEAAHTKVGLIAQSAVQKKITDGPFAPLSDRTLARRKARGFKGEKPLLETGQLRRSINYVIRNKNA